MVQYFDACFFTGLKHGISEHRDQAVSEEDRDLRDPFVFQIVTDMCGDTLFDLQYYRN